jgi:D-isomer specific 2-hydroxyacid dehydrogenase, NAD binding domain
MSIAGAPPQLRVACAGAFAVRLADSVRAPLDTACDIIQADGVEIVSLLHEVALYQALAQKTIAGAALDVWYQYPTDPGPPWPARHAFQELPDVLMTPHVSGWTEGMLEARAQCVVANIHRAARGEPPLHLLPTSAA